MYEVDTLKIIGQATWFHCLLSMLFHPEKAGEEVKLNISLWNYDCLFCS